MGEHAHLDPDTWIGRVRVIMPSEYSNHAWSFFKTYKGDSWHGNDARFIFWMGKNWMLLTALGFLLAGVLGLMIWWVYSRLIIMGSRRRAGGGSPRMSPFRFAGVGSRVPLWKVWSGNEQSYELVAQHDA